MSDKPDYEQTMDLPQATKDLLAKATKQDELKAAVAAVETELKSPTGVIKSAVDDVKAELTSPTVMATQTKQDDMIAKLKQYEFIPSDVLKKSDDTEEYAMPANYTEIKTLTFNPTGVVKRAKLRVKFDMKSGYAGETAYGKIYRNGAAVGTERTNNTTTYQTFSEDIDGWSVFDDIQLYVKYVGTHAPGTYVRNFRVYADIQEITYEPSW